MHWSSQLLSLFEQTHTPCALGCTMYLQHALLLLLPPFLTLSLLIRVPRPAVTLPGLGQHREWHLPDPTTHPHTHTNIDGHNHNRTKQPPFTDSHSLIRGSGKTPIIHMGPDTHMQRQQHPHSPQEERKRREKTGIVGLPQEHYSNASQRLPTKEREKDRERNRWGQRKNESSSSHLRTASSSGMLHERFCVCCSMRLWAHRNTNSKMLLWYFLMPMKSLRCRWSFPLSFQCKLSLKEFWILLFSSAFTFATKM